jgi:hypothetical protein
MVAAFGDFEIRHIAGRGKDSWIVGISLEVYSESMEISGSGSSPIRTASSILPSSSGPKTKSISGICLRISLR